MKTIDTLVSAGFFLNRSDFLRSAAREKLSTYHVEKVRHVSRKQAEKEILNLLDKHPVAYPSDIAAELGLELGMVMEIVLGLLAKREVEEVGVHAHAQEAR